MVDLQGPDLEEGYVQSENLRLDNQIGYRLRKGLEHFYSFISEATPPLLLKDQR